MNYSTVGKHKFICEEDGIYHIVCVGGGGNGTVNGGGDAGDYIDKNIYIRVGESINIIVGGPEEGSCFDEILAAGGINRFGGDVVNSGGNGFVSVNKVN